MSNDEHFVPGKLYEYMGKTGNQWLYRRSSLGLSDGGLMISHDDLYVFLERTNQADLVLLNANGEVGVCAMYAETDWRLVTDG